MLFLQIDIKSFVMQKIPLIETKTRQRQDELARIANSGIAEENKT